MDETVRGDPLLVEEAPTRQIRELLDRLRGELSAAAVWELGLCFDALLEALKERTVQLRSVEVERRRLQEQLGRERREYLQLRASMNELLDLNELSEKISSSFEIEDIIAALMDLSSRFVEYDSGGVFLWDLDSGDLQPIVLQGSSRLCDQVRGLWEDGILDWVMREARPVVIEDFETVARRGDVEHNFVLIPLRVRGKRLGVYCLYCPNPKDEFTAGQIDLLGVLANQTAIAIDNARLYNDLEKTHAQLQESQSQILLSAKLAAIGELAGGVAHEVNNPLQIILSRVQLMMLQNRDAVKLVEGLRLIEHNVKRISRIIRALLGFAGRNLRDQDWGEFDLPQALQQAYALVAHQLDKQGIETTFDCQTDLPAMIGNAGELQQVFINLIINAQNAMPAGGKLQISVRRQEALAEIRFADTGSGIIAENLERIFEPFFTTRAEQGGTGLGLSVSYGIVELHQGAITVQSEPGKGAVFIVRLPFAPPVGGTSGP